MRAAQIVVSVPPAVAAEAPRTRRRSTTPARRTRAARAARARPPPNSGAQQRVRRARSAHIAASSEGGPGSTTMRWPPCSTTTPGAVPTGGSTAAPSGTVACLRLPSRHSAWSSPRAAANAPVIASICASVGSSSTSRRPVTCRDGGDRAVVVRRAEAAGRDDQVDAAARAAPRGRRGSPPRGRRPRPRARARPRGAPARAPGSRSSGPARRPIRISVPVTSTAARFGVTCRSR